MEARPDGRAIDLVTIPSADRAFARIVLAAVRTMEPSTPEALQRTLRAEYPKALVRRRDLASETRGAWYVFRDGWLLGRPIEPGDRDDLRGTG